MAITRHDSEFSRRVREFVLSDFTPHYGQMADRFGTNPLWARLRELGSELWLDTGDVEAIGALWTREFSALTTNNTLLNKEVQKGTYDELVARANELLDGYPELTEQQRKLELAFVLNARHGLKLVETFDAHVSVEEHTDLANDLDGALNYARRYYAVCPERFYVKIPFSPAGLLATRKAADEGIPVNHTLGFAARQNYLIARIARPRFVNVFLGRLNSFVADNDLGGGQHVGQKATLASQAAIRELRRRRGVPTRQIGASFREPLQVRDLAGIDVMTIPPKVAGGLLELGLSPTDLVDRTGEAYEPGLADGIDPRSVGLHTLWDVPPELTACVDELEEHDLDAMSPNDLVEFFAGHGCGDVVVRWSERQMRTSAAEGKIPKLEHWRDPLQRGRIGLDALMNLAGFYSFDTDQQEMDRRVRELVTAARR